MEGVEEPRATFVAGSAGEFIGLRRFRTFGADGPMYEVMEIHPDRLRIYLYNSDEQIDYSIDRALEDPVAT